MTDFNIAGLDVGNAEELERVLRKVYDRGKILGVLTVSERQLEFIGEDYDVYGQSVPLDGKRFRQALFFDSPYGTVELKVEGEDR